MNGIANDETSHWILSVCYTNGIVIQYLNQEMSDNGNKRFHYSFSKNSLGLLDICAIRIIR
jgi:hypothetical protein